jgi:hypothetical protein
MEPENESLSLTNPLVAGSCPKPHENWVFHGGEGLHVVFWDVIPCSLVDGCQRGETHCLQSEGFRTQKATIYTYIMNQFSAVSE